LLTKSLPFKIKRRSNGQQSYYCKRRKEKRAAELIIADKELAYQNKEKGKRAAELFIADKELLFQNEEKSKRQMNSSSQIKNWPFKTGRKKNGPMS